MLAFAGSLPELYLAGVLLGIGTGGRFPLNAAILADYFGLDSFGKVLGLFFLLASLPTTLGSIPIGLLYDAQGSYVVGFLVLAGLTLLGALFFLKAHPPQPAETGGPPAVPVES